MAHELRINLHTATREELIAEVIRLQQIANEWASNWQVIIKANEDAWIDQVRERDEKIAILDRILGGEK